MNHPPRALVAAPDVGDRSHDGRVIQNARFSSGAPWKLAFYTVRRRTVWVSRSRPDPLTTTSRIREQRGRETRAEAVKRNQRLRWVFTEPEWILSSPSCKTSFQGNAKKLRALTCRFDSNWFRRAFLLFLPHCGSHAVTLRPGPRIGLHRNCKYDYVRNTFFVFPNVAWMKLLRFSKGYFLST